MHFRLTLFDLLPRKSVFCTTFDIKHIVLNISGLCAQGIGLESASQHVHTSDIPKPS